MERRVPGPGRITRSRSRRDLRMAMCRDVTTLASRCPGPIRASFVTVLGFAERRGGHENEGTTVLGSGTLTSGQQRAYLEDSEVS
jgi:hypothetical protein